MSTGGSTVGSVNKSCVYYDRSLQKKVPCFLVPNRMSTKETSFEKTVKILHDPSTTGAFSVSKNEFIRYSTDTQRLLDLYPYRTDDEKTYADACIPRTIPNDTTFFEDELKRFEQLIVMLTDVESIKSDFFYKLADFISYDLLFMYNTHSQRVFMLTICTVVLPYVPSPMPVSWSMIHSVKRIFDKYPNDDTLVYNIQNIRNLAEFSYLTFPLSINIPVLKTNVDNFVASLG